MKQKFNGKLLALVLTTVMLSVFLIGCGDSQKTQKISTDDSKSSSVEIKDSINIGISSEFSNLVPMCNNVVVANRDGITLFAMYDPLLWFDTTTSTLNSWIAKEWSVSEDGMEYTLKLRDDVVFHNGTEMTAEDVSWSLNLLPENPAVSTANFPGFDHAEVVDDYTVKIIMATPFAAMPNALASYHLVVLSKDYYDEVGWDGYLEHPIGTGPYKFVKRVIGGSLDLEINEDYWGEKPSIKKVKYSILPDSNAQIFSLETGEIDVLLNASIQNMKKTDGKEGIVWDSSDSFLTCFVNWGGKSTLGEDENLRKALVSAINTDAINNTLNLGYTKQADCLLAPGINARPDDGTYTLPLRYDPEVAKQYLAESGYEEGAPFKIICVAGSKEENICKIIQGDLQAIGINAEVAATDGATNMALQLSGEYDISIYSAMPSLYDANLLYQYFDRNTANFKNYKYPDKEKLADLGLATHKEMDSEARKTLFAEMASLVNEHVYQAYLYHDVNIIAWRTGLQGVKAIPGTNYRVAEWYWQ